MLTHLLDTSVYCQRLKPTPLEGVMRRWRDLGDASLCVSSICEAELRYGLAKRNSQRLWTEFRIYLENKLVLLPVDKQVADRYGDLRSSMESKGMPRSDFDLIIAATALHHGLILATCNVKHFEGVDGLIVEDWRE